MYALQYSCLENSMDGGDWQATVHGVTKSQTRLSTHTHTHTHPPKLMADLYNNCFSFVKNKRDWITQLKEKDENKPGTSNEIHLVKSQRDVYK